MDARQARSTLIKQTRRSILDTLKQVYPGSLSFLSLRYVLPEVEERYLRADISYLADKGYARWVNHRKGQPVESWAGREYVLSARGVEIADALDEDPALEP